MSKDSKKRKIKRNCEDETLEVSCEFAPSKNLSTKFSSDALLSVQCFEEFQVTRNIKNEQKSDEFGSDDSTETVIRNERNENYSQNVYKNICPQNIPSRLSIKAEPMEDISINICENVNGIDDAIKEIDNFIKMVRYTSDISEDLRCHSTEQINESNSLSGANYSGKSIETKIEIQHVSESPTDTALKGSIFPLMTCTSSNMTNTPDSNSVSNNKNVEQTNSSYLQAMNTVNVEKGIKKEPVSPERNESSRYRDLISTKSVTKSSPSYVEDMKCTSPHQTNTPEYHTTEQRNEFKNIPVENFSGRIIESKINFEHASVSRTDKTLKGIFSLQTCTNSNITNTPNSSYLQSMNTENLEKTIKTEPVSPERYESSRSKDVMSPENITLSSPTFVEDMGSSLKSIPSMKSSLFDPNRKFSTDCQQYLMLNVNFDLKDIKECINFIRTKYLFAANIEEDPTPSNSPENISCVSFTNLQKNYVSISSDCNNMVSKLPVNPEFLPDSFTNIPSTLESSLKSIKVESIKKETICSKNKIFSFDENKIQLVKPLDISENSTSLTDKCVSDTKIHHKNVMNFEQIIEKSSKSYEEISDKYIDKESTSSKFCTEKLDEILKKASSVFSSDPPSNNESSRFTSDDHPVSTALQVEAVGSKRQASDVFDVRNLNENSTFIDSKKLKHSLLSEHIGRKKNPSLSQSVLSADIKSGGLKKKLNHQKSSDSTESAVKRIKITDYQNKHRIQPSTFRVQNVDAIGETSTQSLPDPCVLSSGLTSDRLHPYASSIFNSSKQNFDLNQKLPDNIYSQDDEISRDPRLRRRVSSIESSVKPVILPVSTGTIPPVHSSKEVAAYADVQKPRRSFCVIGFKSQKSYHHHEHASGNQKCPRSDASISSSSYCHTSNTVGSSRFHNSQTITGYGEVLTNKTIPAQDVSFQIIGWNAKWLDQVSNKVIPPIFKEVLVVQDSYKNFEDFYGTYYGLHLISIWLDIYKSWKEQQLFPQLSAEFKSCEEKTHHYKNVCCLTMDAACMPVNQSIIHIMYNAENGVKQRLFGFVYDVQQRPIFKRSVSQKDVKFYFYTVEKLRAKEKSIVHICKLSSLRIAIAQLSSLESLRASPMKDILLNPRKHEREIQLLKIASTVTPGTELQGIVNEIINSAASPNNRFILVEQPTDADSLTILSLIRSFVSKRSTVLVCLQDTDRCFQIAQLLCYGFVLALKESEISNIPENFKELTLREAAKKVDELNLEAAELYVLKNAKIILTVTSRIFLGDNKNATLGQKLTLIIQRSTMCTELETALPLSYKPDNVVLLGSLKDTMKLNAHLHLRDYHKSLFHRLYEAKTKCK